MWALYFQRYLPLNLESVAIHGQKKVINSRLLDFHQHSILLTEPNDVYLQGAPLIGQLVELGLWWVVQGPRRVVQS